MQRSGSARTPSPASCLHGNVVPADAADLDTLSQVIADAFHDLAPWRWLIADPAARREIFPGYFQILAEHAMASGVVHTTPDRSAAALWIPVGEDGPAQPPDYDARLAAATRPWTSRFLAFDAALDRHHPAGVPHHHLAILAVSPEQQGQGTGTALLRAYHQILDHDARLTAADGRPPSLAVTNPHAAMLAETVLADATSFWWPWADRIAAVADVTTAADVIARVLAAVPGDGPP